MAQALPTPQPADRSEKAAPAQGKVVALDPARKGQTATPEAVAVLTLFLG
jgi:hypothetical protein